MLFPDATEHNPATKHQKQKGPIACRLTQHVGVKTPTEERNNNAYIRTVSLQVQRRVQAFEATLSAALCAPLRSLSSRESRSQLSAIHYVRMMGARRLEPRSPDEPHRPTT